jgi:hypothetical protein
MFSLLAFFFSRAGIIWLGSTAPFFGLPAWTGQLTN